MIDLTSWIEYILTLFLIVAVITILLIVAWAIFVIWLKFNNREEVSLNFVLLEIAVPKDNEVKIDAIEQMFASLYSIKKGGF